MGFLLSGSGGDIKKVELGIQGAKMLYTTIFTFIFLLWDSHGIFDCGILLHNRGNFCNQSLMLSFVSPVEVIFALGALFASTGSTALTLGRKI